jgi:hypothetical protein
MSGNQQTQRSAKLLPLDRGQLLPELIQPQLRLRCRRGGTRLRDWSDMDDFLVGAIGVPRTTAPVAVMPMLRF